MLKSLKDCMQKGFKMEQAVELEGKYSANLLTPEQKQNTMLLEALFQDKKFLALFNTVLYPKEYKAKVANIIFYGAIAVTFALGLAVNTDITLWSYNLNDVPFFNAIMLYIAYSMFFKSSVENLFFNFKLKKLRKFFSNDKNFLSFLDCLSNNKYVRNYFSNKMVFDDDVTELDIRKAFAYQNPGERDEVVFRNVVEGQTAHIEARQSLKRYISSGSQKDLLVFLRVTNKVISQGIKEDAMSFGVSDKSDLFRAISQRVGN